MSRYTDIVEKVESRTADLAERGNSLHLAANLRFVDGGTSSKYHKSALIGRYILSGMESLLPKARKDSSVIAKLISKNSQLKKRLRKSIGPCFARKLARGI
jgi:hypothetical protein